jgi:DNA-3-methyladenine glycosylase
MTGSRSARNRTASRSDKERDTPPLGRPLPAAFFDRDAQEVAARLLGLVLCRRLGKHWLMASIVEAEAYYLEDKASHASLGYTEKRRALFAPPGTIYMYYARGGDSFNLSVRGAGNAVLFKAGMPLLREQVPAKAVRGWDPSEAGAMLKQMHRLNPGSAGKFRPTHRLCAGQVLLCRSLGLKVPEWDCRTLPSPGLALVDIGYRPERIVRARRLGIPAHRDPNHFYRFVDVARVEAATQNPLGRGARKGSDYEVLKIPTQL